MASRTSDPQRWRTTERRQGGGVLRKARSVSDRVSGYGRHR